MAGFTVLCRDIDDIIAEHRNLANIAPPLQGTIQAKVKEVKKGCCGKKNPEDDAEEIETRKFVFKFLFE